MNKTSITVALTVFSVLMSMNEAGAQTTQLQPAMTGQTMQQGQMQQGQMQQGQMQQGQMMQGRMMPQHQTRVAPTVMPPMQNKYYFGMHVQLIRGYGGTTLRVASVTPGSPAYNAGLEYGDEIRTVNGQGFDYARDSTEAVAMMNRFVDTWTSAPAPAAAAAAPAMAMTTYPPMPAPAPMAQMVVRNVRNGQNVMVTIRPGLRSWGGGGIAPAAPAQASPMMMQRTGK